MTQILTPRDMAQEIIDGRGDEFAYETATAMLYELYKKGYCIWQTYTRDDIRDNIGHRPDDNEMEYLGDALQNFFEWYND